MKGDYQRPVKRLTLFFLLNPLPVNGQSYKKQKRLGTSDQLLFRLWNKITKISLLITYSGSWVIPKITAANLCKPIHDIINSTSICPFESGKCQKEGKKLQKFEYLNISRTKELFRWYKKDFIVFKALSFGEKIKIW